MFLYACYILESPGEIILKKKQKKKTASQYQTNWVRLAGVGPGHPQTVVSLLCSWLICVHINKNDLRVQKIGGGVRI